MEKVFESNNSTYDYGYWEKVTKEDCKKYNDRVETNSIVPCDCCKGKGYIYNAVFDGEWMAKAFRCSKCTDKRKLYLRGHDIGLGEYATKTFADFVPKQDFQKKMYRVMLDYVTEGYPQKKWCCFLGQSGCGKTLAVSAICNTLKTDDILYESMVSFSSFYSINKWSNSQAVTEELERMKRVEVLVLDDMFKVRTEELSMVINVIWSRYNANKITLITSEKTIGEIQEIDYALGSRLVEKCTDRFIMNIDKGANKNIRDELGRTNNQ